MERRRLTSLSGVLKPLGGAPKGLSGALSGLIEQRDDEVGAPEMPSDLIRQEEPVGCSSDSRTRKTLNSRAPGYCKQLSIYHCYESKKLRSIKKKPKKGEGVRDWVSSENTRFKHQNISCCH